MKFKDKDIARFWEGAAIPKRVPPDCRKALFRKLQMLEAAADLIDLKVPPSNHLEKLSGTRSGQYSIRVNQQWRLCFIWLEKEAVEVEFCDYH